MERYIKIKRYNTAKRKRNNWGSDCLYIREYCRTKARKWYVIASIKSINWLTLISFAGQKPLSELDLDELDELEDSEDEAVLLEYRQKRIAELKALAEKSQFGSVVEISGQDYISEVNKAGDGIWVVLHLYKQGYVIC